MRPGIPRNLDSLVAIAIVSTIGVFGHGLHGLTGQSHGCIHACSKARAPGVDLHCGCRPLCAALEKSPRRVPVVTDTCELCELLDSFRSEMPSVESIACSRSTLPVLNCLSDAASVAKPTRRPPVRGPPIVA